MTGAAGWLQSRRRPATRTAQPQVIVRGASQSLSPKRGPNGFATLVKSWLWSSCLLYTSRSPRD
eukprot:1300620-Alexandrium_andersonii.AAC.1